MNVIPKKILPSKAQSRLLRRVDLKGKFGYWATQRVFLSDNREAVIGPVECFAQGVPFFIKEVSGSLRSGIPAPQTNGQMTMNYTNRQAHLSKNSDKGMGMATSLQNVAFRKGSVNSPFLKSPEKELNVLGL